LLDEKVLELVVVVIQVRVDFCGIIGAGRAGYRLEELVLLQIVEVL